VTVHAITSCDGARIVWVRWTRTRPACSGLLIRVAGPTPEDMLADVVTMKAEINGVLGYRVVATGIEWQRHL
jgi:hypothetical protein